MGDAQDAVSRCPFASGLFRVHGSAATAYLVKAAERRGLNDLRSLGLAVHGDGGSIPLESFALDSPSSQEGPAAPEIPNPPALSAQAPIRRPECTLPRAARDGSAVHGPAPLAAHGFAAIGMGAGLPFWGRKGGDGGRGRDQGCGGRSRRPRARQGGSAGRAKAGSGGSDAKASSGRGRADISSASRGAAASSATGSTGSSQGGRCPMRGLYEPAVHAITALGYSLTNLRCPAPVVKLRALVAATPLATDLRRRELATRLAGAVAVAGLCNVPLGMLREHTEKFSWQWLVAVHASIPLVATWRKATLLPRPAIALTIAAAVLGQQVGARLERARLQEEAEAARRAAEAAARGPTMRRSGECPLRDTERSVTGAAKVLSALRQLDLGQVAATAR